MPHSITAKTTKHTAKFLEAMKMIMSLRATAAGKVTHVLASGAIVAAGQLLSTLELADPSKVQMIKALS